MTDIIRANVEPDKFPLGKIFFNTNNGKYFVNTGTYDVPVFKDITFGVGDEITNAINAFKTEIGFDLPLTHTSETNSTGCYFIPGEPSITRALNLPSGNRRSGSTHTVISACSSHSSITGSGRSRIYIWTGTSWAG